MLVTIADAATLLGTSEATVHVEVRRRGVSFLGRNELWTPDNLAKLRLLVDQQGKLKISAPKAALIIGCDRDSLVQGLLAIQGRGAPLPSHKVDRKKLERLLADDGALTVSVAEAALELNCSVKVLKRILRNRGLRAAKEKEAKPTAASVLTPLCKNGMLTLSVAKAAANLKVSGQTIRNWMKELGVTAPPTSGEALTHARDEKLKDMCKDGRLTIPVQEAAKKLKCTVDTIRRSLARQNLRFPPNRSHTPNRLNSTPSSPRTTAALLVPLRRWLPRLTPIDVARAISEVPSLAQMTDESIAFRLGALARVFNVDQPTALSMALSAPALFEKDIAEIRTTVKTAEKFFGAREPLIFPQAPHAATLDATTFSKRMNDLTTYLAISNGRLAIVLRRSPNIANLEKKHLITHARATSKHVGIPIDSVRAAMRRQPNLLLISPDATGAHCSRAVRLLGLPRTSIARAFISNPSLLQVKPETLKANVRKGARLLGCPLPQLSSAYLNRPALFTMKPETVAGRAHNLATLFKSSDAAMVKTLLTYPYLLTFATDNTREKLWLLIKLAEAVGRKEMTPADILTHAPSAFSYAKERIAARVEMARRGIGPKSIGRLLSMSDEAAAELVTASQIQATS